MGAVGDWGLEGLERSCAVGAEEASDGCSGLGRRRLGLCSVDLGMLCGGCEVGEIVWVWVGSRCCRRLGHHSHGSVRRLGSSSLAALVCTGLEEERAVLGRALGGYCTVHL